MINENSILTNLGQVKLYSKYMIVWIHQIVLYTLYRNWWYAHFHFLLLRQFKWEPLELHEQMIPHFLALDVGVKISQAQLCTSIRDCHATFLVKNTLFKGEVAWQPLKELQISSSSILEPPTRAFKWDIVCLSPIITFKVISDVVKKCWFYIVKVDFLDIITYFFKSYNSRKTNNTSIECSSGWVQNTRRTDLQFFQGLSSNLFVKKCVFY